MIQFRNCSIALGAAIVAALLSYTVPLKAQSPRLIPQLGPLIDINKAAGLAMDMSEDGSLIAIGDENWTTLWNIEFGRQILRIPGSGIGVSISSDNLFLAVTDYGSILTIWNVNNSNKVTSIKLSGNVDHVSFVDGERRVLVCGSVYSERTWCKTFDFSQGSSLVERTHYDEKQGSSIAVSQDNGSALFLFDYESDDNFELPQPRMLGWAKLGEQWEKLSVFESPLDVVYQMTVLPGEIALLRGENWDKRIALVNTRLEERFDTLPATLSERFELENNIAHTNYIEWHFIHLIDMKRQQVIYTLPDSRRFRRIYGLSSEQLAIMLDPDCSKGLAGEIMIMSYPSKEVKQRLQASSTCDLFPVAANVSRNGESMAVAWAKENFVKMVVMYELDRGRWSADSVFQTKLHSLVTNLAFEKDWLMVDSDNTVTLWDLRKGSVTHQFPHKQGENMAHFTDSSVLVYVSDNQDSPSIKIWNERDGSNELFVPNNLLYDNEEAKQLHITGDIALIELGRRDDGAQGNNRIDSNGLVAFRPDSIFDGSKSMLAPYRIQPSFSITDTYDRDVLIRKLKNGDIVVLASVIGEGFRIEIYDARTGHVKSSHSYGKELDLEYVDIKGLFEDGESLILMSDNTDFSSDPAIETTRVIAGDIRNFENSLRLLVRYSDEFTGYFGPVVYGHRGVREILKKEENGVVERLSPIDGSILDTPFRPIAPLERVLAFGVSDDHRETYIIVDIDGNAVFFNTQTGVATPLDTMVGAWHEPISFSPAGLHIAVKEIDGTVSIWNVSDGSLLARLLNFQTGEWAVVAPDGRYDASDPADLDGLSWVMPDAPTKPVPLTIFYREYYEPRLLPRLLAGEKFPPIASIAELDRTQPKVTIAEIESAGANRVNVSVEVNESGTEGVQDLKLFRNGRLVGLDALGSRPQDLDKGEARRVTFRNIELPTTGPEVIEFSAYAFNDDGIKSDTHRLPYSRSHVAPHPRQAFVIVVGVNAYQNQSWDLRYAADDARATGEIVTRHIKASGEFQEVHPVLLIAERDKSSGAITGIATREALLAVLDVLAGEAANQELLGRIPGAASLRKARPDDLVYLAFSGHGLSGDNGLFHLFLSDIGEGERRVVDSALLTRTLDSDLLARHLSRVDAGDFVMVVDACNSAASVEGGGFKPGPMGSRSLGQLAYDKAMRVVAASQAEAVALESEQLRHGLLTFAMLHEGLAGGAADRAPTDSAIGFAEMLTYGVERVPLLYEDIRSGNFVPQGRGATAHVSLATQATIPPSPQRPSLFDFSRGERDVRLPVIDPAD